MGIVDYEREGPLGFLTLNRPDKLNALNEAMVDGVIEHLAEARADDEVKVLVLTGAGRSFCAGFDLTSETDAPIKGAGAWHRNLERDVDMTMAIWSFPKPTIALVRGWCLGGGCEVAMACDIVLATEDARFGEPEIRYGSGPVTLLMPFVIGHKRANELLFTGSAVRAAEAERIGLVNHVVPEGELEARGRQLAGQIALAPLGALTFTKLGLNRAWQAAGLEQAVRANLDLSAILNSLESPEQEEFDRITAAQGLKAALAWRDSRYGAGLGDS